MINLPALVICTAQTKGINSFQLMKFKWKTDEQNMVNVIADGTANIMAGKNIGNDELNSNVIINPGVPNKRVVSAIHVSLNDEAFTEGDKKTRFLSIEFPDPSEGPAEKIHPLIMTVDKPGAKPTISGSFGVSGGFCEAHYQQSGHRVPDMMHLYPVNVGR